MHTDSFKKPKLIFIRQALFLILGFLCFTSGQILADETGSFNLVGVDLLEGTNFMGTQMCSMNGGCNIVVQGIGYSARATDFTVLFNDGVSTMTLPPLSQANVFQSNVLNNLISYTSPSITSLYGESWTSFDSTSWFSFTVSLIDDDSSSNWIQTLSCQNAAACQVVYQRQYTPYMYYITPQVVYFGSNTTYAVNPKSTMNAKQPQDMPTQTVSIDSENTNFEYVLDTDTVLSAWTTNYILGSVGPVVPNPSSSLIFQVASGNAYFDPVLSVTCDINNENCYQAKSLAVVNSVSDNSGFTTGGQLLTLNGYGFYNQTVTITTDGIPCVVLNQSQTEVVCITGSKSSVSTIGVNQPGQNGMRRQFYNRTGLSLSNIHTFTPTWTQLITVFEAEVNLWNGEFANNFTGYFKAPLTTNYRFYMACDDTCQLSLSTVNLSPSSKTIIIQPYSTYSTFRNYFTENGSKQSAWIALTAGQYYYLEGLHIQFAGGDDFSISVEIQQSAIADHQNIFKNIQQILIEPPSNVQFETWTITIQDPDAGHYILGINSGNSSGSLPCFATAAQFQNAFAYYYSYYFGATITVTSVMNDTNGNPTTNQLNATTISYTVVLNRLLNQKSFTTLSFASDPAHPTAAILVYQQLIQSSPTIGGTFQLNCYTSAGMLMTTAAVAAQASTGTIYNAIITSCPNFQDRISISEGTAYNQWVDTGRDLLIRLQGVAGTPTQISVPITTTTLTGGGSGYFRITNDNLYPISSNIMYEPIPFELLYTPELSPQISVQVGGLSAACQELDCQYKYITATSAVTSYSLDGDTLTITGTNLPTTTLSDVSISNAPCLIVTSSATEIVCTASVVAGTWQPQVRAFGGYVPNSSTATIVVPIVVSAVTPVTGINPNGYTLLTITGQGFPNYVGDGNDISIIFPDGLTPNAICVVVNSTDTAVQCRTPPLEAGSNPGITINVNGQIDTSLSVVVANSPGTVASISPTSASPVLKQILVLQMADSFTGTLEISDLSVELISTTNSTFVIPTNVVGVDNNLMQIQVKYGGAPSGAYDLQVISTTYGKFDATAVLFTAGASVTAFSPTQGSVYGGTLVTITGDNFSNTITDNPVMIGWTPCIVQTTNPTTITCLTQAHSPLADTTGEVLTVMLQTSEEAPCLVSGGCAFTWVLTGLPSLTTSSYAFDTTQGAYIATLTGEGFTAGDTVDTQLWIDGFQQTTQSVTSTVATFMIKNTLDVASSNVFFYTAIGIPNGAANMTYEVNPQPISVSPSIGSPAGTLVIMSVPGVGVNTANLQIVSAANTNIAICSSVTVMSYGVINCIAVGSYSVTLKVKQSTSVYSCINVALCTYTTSTSTMPSFTSLAYSVSASTINFTGANFMGAYSGVASLDGINSTSVTFNSLTSVTAYFANGVPVTSSATVPTLLFDNGVNVYFSQGSATINNVITTTAVAQSITCSFAGGCQLTINQAGLSSNLANSDENYITVCGLPCPLDPSSTNTYAVCDVPILSTIYSIENFNVTESDYIQGTPFGSVAALAPDMFDGNTSINYVDPNTNCYVGTSFTAGHIGLLSEVSFYMNVFVQSKMANLVSFQGSNDGVTYTTIFEVGYEIHEGWNYYPFTTQPEYRFYKFQGTSVGSCQFGQINMRGVQVINDNNPTYTCNVGLQMGTTTTTFTGTVQYQAALTPLLTSISPRFGQVEGGDTITFTGTNFITDTSQYNIVMDGQQCSVISATTTQVQCITSPRPGLPPMSLQMSISSMGDISTNGLFFIYCNYWSNTNTWGGEFAPMDGDSVYIPVGLNLCVDVDSTPILDAIVVEGGSLIFPPDSDPTHLRTFDASYIMLDAGAYMEVGTEDFPYTSKLVITMHGSKTDPVLPMYGNKVIAVRNSILDMHGPVRNPTWCMLETTAEVGDTSIELQQAVDWQAGEIIVIAPTQYNNMEAEELTIVSVDRTNPNNPIVHLSEPLQYQHYADTEYYGTEGDFIDMRAEVGLLSRNVVYQGDPETSPLTQYGAHIMLSSPGDESLIGRIGYIELRNVGQAYQLGRYPIHFHLIGTVSLSYAMGNSIHDTYNRAMTFHGVHYLRSEYNFAYNTMGHSFFIEDAIETKNYLAYNLVIQTHRSWSLLNTDMTPACFWITNPDNMFIGNHAVGADRYGYWYDSKPFPTGPSATTLICPQYMEFNLFENNVAHSNLRYGFRLFHRHIPITYPCQNYFYNSSNPSNPYASNPLVTGYITNLTTWMNVESGTIIEEIGDIRILNCKSADNQISQIEVSMTPDTMDGTAQVINALMIGNTGNSNNETNSAQLWGLITPRTENFQVNGARFYNFQYTNQSAFGSCSHCFHPAATDSGARTITFTDIWYDDATVPMKIRYQYPWRDIYFDKDGTLTSQAPGSWATPYFPHNVQPGCTVNLPVFNGILCDNSVQIRRLFFHDMNPTDLFINMDLKIIQYDSNVINANGFNLTTYLLNVSNYGIMFYHVQWALPIVTGHTYKIHWEFGLDFDSAQWDISPRWQPSDNPAVLIFNFTDVRARVDIMTGTNLTSGNEFNDLIPNTTLLTVSNSNWETGDNVIYNDTATRLIEVVIDGANSSRQSVDMIGYRCWPSCFPSTPNVPIETTIRYWSNASSWDNYNYTVPTAGMDVEVMPGWNMYYDLPESPPLSFLEINGQLTFDPAQPTLSMTAAYIFVKAGILIIGNETNPFPGYVNITLTGTSQDQYIVISDAVEAGDKILANTNLVSIYGLPRSYSSRLLSTINVGDTQITVETGLDWGNGDQVGIAANTMNWDHVDYAYVTSYDSTTGIAQLDRPLDYYHWGQATSTASQYSGIDMRAEVVMLTRNVLIMGDNEDNWGCQIITTDFVEVDGYMRNGSTYMNNVEVYNCSQRDTYMAAIRFDQNMLGQSVVSNCSIHHGSGRGVEIDGSQNIAFLNNVVFDFVKRGINLQTSNSVIIDSNQVHMIRARGLDLHDDNTDLSAGINICGETGLICPNITVTNNIVSGSTFVGIVMYGRACGNETDMRFTHNVVHSISGGGANIYPDRSDPSQVTCTEAAYFNAYKCQVEGAVAAFAVNSATWMNFVLIDNGYSASLNIGMEDDYLYATILNSQFYGETPARDCHTQNVCLNGNGIADLDVCVDRYAMMLSEFTRQAKDVFPTMSDDIPISVVMSDASWGGNINYNGNTFTNFVSNQTYCGDMQYLFTLNSEASDYSPMAELQYSTFNNVNYECMAYIFDPPAEWANMDDCGEFPCSAPNNIVIEFFHATLSGMLGTYITTSTFQIISKNSQATKNYQGCSLVPIWNANLCMNREKGLGVLLFESLDSNAMMRSVTPIMVSDNKDNTTNTLNSFMDHLWDGFYTSQLKLARFPSIVQVDSGINQIYNISYTGTPPTLQRFVLKADAQGLLVSIQFPISGTYQIFNGDPTVNGTLYTPNTWNDNILAENYVTGQFCGENRFVGVVNILEFYISPNCLLYLVPQDQITCGVRMSWTLEGFYAAGGTTTFVDRVAAVLGIQEYTIRVVAVYTGSVVVQFSIIYDPTSTQTLAQTQTLFQNLVLSGSSALGAPIISGTVSGMPVVTSGGASTSGGSSGGSGSTTGPVVVDTNSTTVKNTTSIVVQQTTQQSIDQSTKTSMVIIIGAIVGALLLSGVIGLIIWCKCKKPTLDNKQMTIKSMPVNGESPDPTVSYNNYEPQYHPKAEIGNLFLQGDINKGNQDEVMVHDEVHTHQSNIMQTHGELDKSPLSGNHASAFNSSRFSSAIKIKSKTVPTVMNIEIEDDQKKNHQEVSFH